MWAGRDAGPYRFVAKQPLQLLKTIGNSYILAIFIFGTTIAYP
jgi:hypothetical protein